MAELADAPDSKSGAPRGVWVRFPPSASAPHAGSRRRRSEVASRARNFLPALLPVRGPRDESDRWRVSSRGLTSLVSRNRPSGARSSLIYLNQDRPTTGGTTLDGRIAVKGLSSLHLPLGRPCDDPMRWFTDEPAERIDPQAELHRKQRAAENGLRKGATMHDVLNPSKREIDDSLGPDWGERKNAIERRDVLVISARHDQKRREKAREANGRSNYVTPARVTASTPSAASSSSARRPPRRSSAGSGSGRPSGRRITKSARRRFRTS